MAYVPGFLHDVFISYATASDLMDGLVRSFRDLLAEAIGEEGLRVNKEDFTEGVDILLDRRGFKSGEDLPEQVRASARGTAVFIAVHSPAYLKSKWCEGEAREFTSNYDPLHPNLEGRLFVISLNARVSPGQSPVEALRRRRFRRFFYVDQDGEDFPFDPHNDEQKNPDGKTLKEEARKLAREIVPTIEAMRKDAPAPRVFLASTSPERATQADDIKSWLLQKQALVLRVSTHVPDWESDARALIARADVFVDLHENSPTAEAVRQAAIATELGRKRTRWLPRGGLTAEAASEVMKETQLVEDTLEKFKESLEPLLVRPTVYHKVVGLPPGADGGPAVHSPLVLFVSAKTDVPRLAAMEQKLRVLGCSSDAHITPDTVAEPDLWHRELENLVRLHDPAGVVFVDGDCAGEWRDKRMREVIAVLRSNAPRLTPALCVFPPPVKPDRRLNLQPPLIIRIDSSQIDQLGTLLGIV